MASAKVNIETSIPSFFFETRLEPDMGVRGEWTRQWWNEAGPWYTLMTTVAVIEEPERGEVGRRIRPQRGAGSRR